MKFLLLALLVPLSIQAQVCTQATLLTASYPLLNCDSLTISSPINLSHISGPIEISVNGDVLISSSVNLSGFSGQPLSIDLSPGALGGPGGSPSGGRDFLEAQPTPDNPHSGFRGEYENLLNCADGGAGGGFSEAGKNGTPCTNSNLTPSLGGVAFNYSNIESTLRGGFGGGTGGGNSGPPIFGGGGGGGAIYINATGKVTITSKASITANGGNGANSTNSNGGGGGGSGGVIIIQGSELDIKGRLQALGGLGGKSPFKGHGGAGGPGLIRLKTASGDQDFIGVKPEIRIEELKLDSPISCGMVKTKEESRNTFFQIIIPLLLCVGVSLFKKKSQDQV